MDSVDKATTFHYYATTNADIKPHVLNLIISSYYHVYLERFDLTDTDVINTLETATYYGVDVRVLLDPNQSSNRTTYNTLIENGVKIGLRQQIPSKRY